MSFKSKIKDVLQPLKRFLVGDMTHTHQLVGRLASWEVRSRTVISSLRDVEFKVTSQWGEDGIIDWLIERAGIPPRCHSFVEFGVEDYRQSNTRFLLQNRSWRGLILDGSSAMLRTVEEDFLKWGYDLTARPAFITRENINELIGTSGFKGEIGLLSIDLDGNDYWVWEAIEVVQPIICVCEYNPVFGDVYPISTPYDPSFYRTKAHYSNLYFGASVAALRSLALRKGYRFVGTTTAANDAFFVREDYAQRLVGASLRSVEASPPRVRESKDERGQLSYLGGLDRLKRIAHLPVVNVDTGATTPLGELQGVYSREWLEIMFAGSVQC